MRSSRVFLAWALGLWKTYWRLASPYWRAAIPGQNYLSVVLIQRTTCSRNMTAFQKLWKRASTNLRKVRCVSVKGECFYLSTMKDVFPLIHTLCSPTCCRNDAVTALTTEAWEQAGLSSTCQANAHHIILGSWRWGSFTAQCPETLKQNKQKNKCIGKQKNAPQGRWARLNKDSAFGRTTHCATLKTNYLGINTGVSPALQEESRGHYSCFYMMKHLTPLHVKGLRNSSLSADLTRNKGLFVFQ